MNHSIKYMDPSELSVGVNTRVGASNDFENMALSLEDRGMDEPVQAWKTEDGRIEILRGHRRHAGATILNARSPKVFKGHFPQGIPVIIRKDITNASQAALAKVDHGTVVTLKYKCERNRAVIILKDEGCTEKEITSRCEGIFSKHQNAIPSDKRDKLEALRASPEKNRIAIRDLVHGTYKGQLQASVAVWKCPSKVQACLEHLEAKEPLPKGIKCPAKLTYGDVKKLAAAQEEDNQVKDAQEMPLFSKGNPGPAFKALWAELLAAKPKTGETRAKAMSSKDMQAQLDNGIWDSAGFKALTLQHTGKKDVKGLKALDADLYMVDLVKRHEPAVWKDFTKKAEAIKNAIADGTLNA